MSLLFSPLTLRGTTFRNRAWVAPMCQYSSVDGMPTDWHLVHLGARATGGAGLVLTEATAVSPEGRISPADAGIWSDAHAAAYRRITDFVRAAGRGARRSSWPTPAARPARRRPGRAHGYVEPADGGWETVGASADAFGRLPAPRALDDAGLAAGPRRLRGGHPALASTPGSTSSSCTPAHGYLLNTFLSPLSNTRTDAYGGMPGEPDAAAARGGRGGPRRLAGRPAPVRAHLRHRLGRGRLDRRGLRRARARARGPRRGPGRLLHRRGGARGEHPGRPRLPGALRRPGPRRRGRAHRRGRPDHRAQAGRGDPRRGRGRRGAAGAGRCSASRPGRCAPPPSWATTWPGRRSTSADAGASREPAPAPDRETRAQRRSATSAWSCTRTVAPAACRPAVIAAGSASVVSGSTRLATPRARK